jgi:hypothetical protein
MSKITLIGGTLLILGLGSGVILDRSVLIKARVSSTEGVSGDMPLTHLPEILATSTTLDADQVRANPTAVNSVSPQEQHQAALRAEAIIETGQWGDAERSDFRQQLGLMSPEERERVTQKWIQGIESGSIKVSTTGPML